MSIGKKLKRLVSGPASLRSSRVTESKIDKLNLLAKEIPADLSQDQLLKEIIARAVGLLSGNSGGIYLFDAKEEVLTIVAQWAAHKSIKGHRLKAGEGLCGWVAQNKKPRRVTDYSKFAGRVQSPDHDPNDYHSVVAAPLSAKENDILGALYVTDNEKGVYSEHHEVILTLFANQTGLILDRAKKFAQLELLTQISNEISSALTLRELLENVLTAALKAIGTDEGSVMVLNPTTNQLEVKAWVVGGKPVEIKIERQFKLKEGIAGNVAASRKPYICADSTTDPLFVKSPSGRNPRSILSIPIISNKSLLCILNADNAEDHFFKKGDVELLLKLADQVAFAIESQRLRDSVSSLSTLGSRDLYAKIVENALYLTNADLSALFIQPEGTRKLKRMAVFPPSGECLSPIVRRRGLTQMIFSKPDHSPVIINDALTNPLVKQSLKDRKVKALIGVPLYFKLDQEDVDKVLGVLYVSTTQDREFTERDGQILRTFASQAAIAMANFWLYSYQQSLVSKAFDAIFSVDRNGKIKEFNNSARNVLGYETDDDIRNFVAHTQDLFVRPQDLWKICRELMRKDSGGRLIDFKTDLKKKKGEGVSVRLSAALFEDGIVVFFRDQSQIERASEYIQNIQRQFDSGAVAQSKDLNEALNTTVEMAREQFGADPVCLFYYDDELDVVLHPRIRRVLLDQDAMSAGDGKDWLVRRLIKQAQEAQQKPSLKEFEIFSADTRSEPLLKSEFVEREKIRATAALPLLIGKKEKRVVGFLFINFREPHTFGKEEIDSIKRFASEAASAIHMAHSSHMAQRKGGQFYALQSAVNVLASLDSESSLRSILVRSLETTNAEFSGLGVWKEGEKFDLFLTVGPNNDSKRVVLNQEGLLADVFHSSDEVRAYREEASSLPLEHRHMRTFLGVPITYKKKPIGILYVANKREAPDFDSEDVVSLKHLAAPAALGIKIQNPDSSHDRDNIEMAYVLFARFARNLRTVGLKVSEEFDELRRRLLGSKNQVYVNTISNLLSEFNSPGYLGEMEETPIAAQTLNFSSLMERLVKNLDLSKTTTVEKRIEPALFVKGSQLYLELMLRILFDNAIAAINRSGKPGTLKVVCFARGKYILTTIEDSGDGLSKEAEKNLFKRPVEQGDGLRYASFTAAKIAEYHAGYLEVVATDKSHGTEVLLRLPEVES